MRSERNSTWPVAFAYMGAVIGAGFASGQEAAQFFLPFGPNGLWGIALATALLSFFGAVVLVLARRWNTVDYQHFIMRIFTPRLGHLIDGLLGIFMFAGLGIMLAGSGAVADDLLGVNSHLGTLIVAVIVAFVLIGGVERVIAVNTWLVPPMVAVMLIVCWLSTMGSWADEAGYLPPAPVLVGNVWWISSLLYVSYNISIGLVLLASLGYKRPSAWGGIVGGIGLGLILGATFAGMQGHLSPEPSQLPMLYLAGLQHPILRLAYGGVLLVAMITTAVADGFGLAARLSHAVPYRLAAVGIVLFSLPVARYGFAALVGGVYPLFGYMGLVILFAVTYRLVKSEDLLSPWH